MNVLHVANEKGKKSRNNGIDILKIMSMFMVLILHLLGHGGIIRSFCGKLCFE